MVIRSEARFAEEVPRPGAGGNQKGLEDASELPSERILGSDGKGVRRRCPYARLEEFFDSAQNLGRALRLVDGFAQGRPARHPVREPRRELLHLADSVWKFLFDEHPEVGTDHLVAVEFSGFVVGFARRQPGRPDFSQDVSYTHLALARVDSLPGKDASHPFRSGSLALRRA